jgi:4-aminobutyrate aminotransferase
MTKQPPKNPPAPQIVVAPPGPNAQAWIDRDRRTISPSYTRDHALVVRRGHGCTIEDVDGNLFLDFTAGIAVTSTGHCHPEVVRAIADQAARLIHMSGTDFYYSPEIELAERLVWLAPGAFEKKVFFSNSGAEAIEAALKLVRHHTGRSHVIAFERAFHGRTFGALSLCASKPIHREGFGPLLAGIHHLPYNCDLATVERLFANEVPADEVAAIFVEPIQGEGGYHPAEPQFLKMLEEVCRRRRILLVADEIQTGVGRTGTMFAVEHYGVEPDVICLAKGLASGMPLGAIVARADVMNWPPGSHASTFGGNPVCCRAALATLDLVEREYLANTVERGRQLQDGLQRLAERHDWAQNARGRGLMLAVDVVDAQGEFEPIRRNAIIQAAFQRGLLLLGCGKSAIRFCPALCVTDREVDAALEILDAILLAEK